MSHDFFFHIIDEIALVIELVGVIMIVVAVMKEVYNIAIVHKFNFEETGEDLTINYGLSNALEVLLSAEILKTITFENTTQLIQLAALVFIRVFITVTIHWELENKKKGESIPVKLPKSKRD